MEIRWIISPEDVARVTTLIERQSKNALVRARREHNLAKSNGITHFVDDDRKVLALFARFAPSVAAIDFEDRERLLRRPITSAEP